MGTLRLLEAIRDRGLADPLLPGGSSRDVRPGRRAPQTETTPFYPRSPYAIAKVFAHWMTRRLPRGVRDARQQRDPVQPRVPRRGETFVTRKVTRGDRRDPRRAGREQLYLGNLDAQRDWGYAPEYVEAMWRMLQQDEPDDYVIATGEMHTVREFVRGRLRAASGSTGSDYVEIDPRYLRPTEVDELSATPQGRRAARLGADGRRSTELVRIMLEADLREAGLDPAAVHRRWRR